MERLLHLLARGLIAGIQALPLRWAARVGRAGGAIAWWVDARHRRIALLNLSQALGHERSPAEIAALARENFRRLGENYVCGIKTAGMEDSQLEPHFEVAGLEKLMVRDAEGRLPNRVVAIGHFGNFELFARVGHRCPGYRSATTYRGLPQESLNRLMQGLRARSGCLFFERRREGRALKAAMAGHGLLLGLLSDQHAGDGGLRLAFFGRECSTSPAPVVFARRYRCPLHVAVCYRTALGSWRIEISDEVPLAVGERPRTPDEIMLEVNRAFEVAIRRDPANWFWVHRRWKPAPPGQGPAPLGSPAAVVTG